MKTDITLIGCSGLESYCFVNHPSNKALAKFTVYTNGKTPEAVADEILRTVGFQVDTPKISE